MASRLFGQSCGNSEVCLFHKYYYLFFRLFSRVFFRLFSRLLSYVFSYLLSYVFSYLFSRLFSLFYSLLSILSSILPSIHLQISSHIYQWTTDKYFWRIQLGSQVRGHGLVTMSFIWGILETKCAKTVWKRLWIDKVFWIRSNISFHSIHSTSLINLTQ